MTILFTCCMRDRSARELDVMRLIAHNFTKSSPVLLLQVEPLPRDPIQVFHLLKRASEDDAFICLYAFFDFCEEIANK